MMNHADINETMLDFLIAPYASMSADELLSYFQTRNGVRYFPLSSGSQYT